MKSLFVVALTLSVVAVSFAGRPLLINDLFEAAQKLKSALPNIISAVKNGGDQDLTNALNNTANAVDAVWDNRFRTSPEDLPNIKKTVKLLEKISDTIQNADAEVANKLNKLAAETQERANNMKTKN
ncbi:uncharacterized protein LOC129748595 [Uranotaenia lowii]|uniref:uncharacterized protein LOC129748595 n=1 Tax=Uranotaenia lowii TaxID=190385 RepID=UPI00247A5706|nr:uncharacterized protein LOC129748595 [Uranotaenia lowii]